MMRVRFDVNGTVFHDGEFVELDHDREWGDRHPLVVANPDAFEPVGSPLASLPKPRSKKKET